MAELYPELLERLVVINAPMARLWSRNVFYYPQLFMVRTRLGFERAPATTALTAATARSCARKRRGSLQSSYVFFFQLPYLAEWIMSNFGYSAFYQLFRAYPREEIDCFVYGT